ncbi:hypothetical protein JTB14_033537 [Gonioctena quinquepunctata]|nr:hypothetical protein JTB14_033537 [Gonioctena quinquepunctata]
MDDNDSVFSYNNNWREFACGWGAAFINVSVTYPINKLIFRQMLHGVEVHHAYSQLKSEGLFYLYRGMMPPLCQKTVSLSIMFGVYDQVRRPLINLGFNKYIAKAIGAMASGTTEAILMPFERVQTLLADAKYHGNFKNTLHAFKVVRKYGYGEYYRGLIPILMRNGPSNVGFFIARDEIQERLPKYENELFRTSSEFLCGAMIGVVLSTLFYPLNVWKIAMQSKVGGPFDNPFKILYMIVIEQDHSTYYGHCDSE